MKREVVQFFSQIETQEPRTRQEAANSPGDGEQPRRRRTAQEPLAANSPGDSEQHQEDGEWSHKKEFKNLKPHPYLNESSHKF